MKPATDTGLPRGAVACLSLAAFASGASLRLNDALLPKLALDFGISLGEASQVISVYAIAYGFAQVLFGPLGDRYGKYRVVAWAALACALTALGCALAGSFVGLLLARVLAGATAAAIIPLSMAWLGDVIAYERRQPVLARFLIGQITGLSAGVWLGGFAADHLSWRAPYLLMALIFAGVALALFVLQRRLPANARQMRPAAGSALRRIVADFSFIFAQRWARVILGLAFLEGMWLYGPFAFIATHVHQRFGLSLSSAGAMVMLFGLGGLVFAAASHQLVARLRERGLAKWGGAAMAGALAAIAFGPNGWWAVAGCLIAGLGYYMMHNTLQVNATQMVPERRGAAVAAFAACFFLGQSAGVALGGWLVGIAGTALFLALGAAALLALGLAFAAQLGKRES